MQLTDREKEMLDGKDGEAVRIAMSILSDIGDAVEAEEMTEIVHVHGSNGSRSPAGIRPCYLQTFL